jgi:hypothetical protein
LSRNPRREVQKVRLLMGKYKQRRRRIKEVEMVPQGNPKPRQPRK